MNVISTDSQDRQQRRLFGTDGIRGIANTAPMTAEIALRLGQAAGLLFTRGNHRHRGGYPDRDGSHPDRGGYFDRSGNHPGGSGHYPGCHRHHPGGSHSHGSGDHLAHGGRRRITAEEDRLRSR